MQQSDATRIERPALACGCCGAIPQEIAGQADMLPAKRRCMGEPRIGRRLSYRAVRSLLLSYRLAAAPNSLDDAADRVVLDADGWSMLELFPFHRDSSTTRVRGSATESLRQELSWTLHPLRST